MLTNFPVTFLAFIFVPFSLSTSVFGMNLQELNRNGQHVWAFLITSFVLFVVFLALYALATMVYIARNNYKERSVLLKPELDTIARKSIFSDWEFKRRVQKRWSPSRLCALVRRGLLLALLSGGRFDPKGYEYEHRNWDITDEKAAPFKNPIPDRYGREFKYFLGLHRLPREENYDQLWKVRDDADGRPDHFWQP